VLVFLPASRDSFAVHLKRAEALGIGAYAASFLASLSFILE